MVSGIEGLGRYDPCNDRPRALPSLLSIKQADERCTWDLWSICPQSSLGVLWFKLRRSIPDLSSAKSEYSNATLISVRISAFTILFNM